MLQQVVAERGVLLVKDAIRGRRIGRFQNAGRAWAAYVLGRIKLGFVISQIMLWLFAQLERRHSSKTVALELYRMIMEGARVDH